MERTCKLCATDRMAIMAGLVKLTAVLLALSGQLEVEGLWCDRTPAGVNVPKTPGDNGYKIVISGDSDKYIPGGVYSGKLVLYYFIVF